LLTQGSLIEIENLRRERDELKEENERLKCQVDTLIHNSQNAIPGMLADVKKFMESHFSNSKSLVRIAAFKTFSVILFFLIILCPV